MRPKTNTNKYYVLDSYDQYHYTLSEVSGPPRHVNNFSIIVPADNRQGQHKDGGYSKHTGNISPNDWASEFWTK